MEFHTYTLLVLEEDLSGFTLVSISRFPDRLLRASEGLLACHGLATTVQRRDSYTTHHNTDIHFVLTVLSSVVTVTVLMAILAIVKDGMSQKHDSRSSRVHA